MLNFHGNYHFKVLEWYLSICLSSLQPKCVDGFVANLVCSHILAVSQDHFLLIILISKVDLAIIIKTPQTVHEIVITALFLKIDPTDFVKVLVKYED